MQEEVRIGLMYTSDRKLIQISIDRSNIDQPQVYYCPLPTEHPWFYSDCADLSLRLIGLLANLYRPSTF